MIDGAYCDAGYHDGIASLAAVLCLGGIVVAVETLIVEAEDNHKAECEAIAFAKRKFEGVEVFNDNSSACEECGAIWIPREENYLADTAERVAFDSWKKSRSPDVPMILNRVQAKRQRRKSSNNRKKKMGRGCLPSGELNRFVNN